MKDDKINISKNISVAILTCWYGAYPWYFPYFIHSCSFNPTIDFIIITDNNKEFICKQPGNVKIIHKTMEEIKTTASKKLGFSVNIDSPYKLCDFKPTYGSLFSELLERYDFWGYGDIDVIYGDLRYFLNDQLLTTCDIFSFRSEYLYGALTIFRNMEKMNHLFMESCDFENVLSNPDYFNFDECNFMFVPLWDGIPIESVVGKIDSMSHVVKRKAKEGCLRAYFDFNLIEGKIGNIKWQNGKVLYKNKFEAILYHLLKFKDHYKHKDKKPKFSKNTTIYFSRNNIYKRIRK